MYAVRFVRRGRAATSKDDDIEIASDCEAGELRDWLDRSMMPASLWNTVRPDCNNMVRKYLPPGNVMELFQEYQAARCLLGSSSVSNLFCKQNVPCGQGCKSGQGKQFKARPAHELPLQGTKHLNPSTTLAGRIS